MVDYDAVVAFGLTVFAVGWCIALVSTFERDCRRVSYGVSKAERRASTLLREWLTQEQNLQYYVMGYFEVRGSHSGRRYRIRYGRQMNVDQLDERGHRVASLCFLPEKYVPISDVMLAQKIMLENDELSALSVAGRTARTGYLERVEYR